MHGMFIIYKHITYYPNIHIPAIHTFMLCDVANARPHEPDSTKLSIEQKKKKNRAEVEW